MMLLILECSLLMMAALILVYLRARTITIQIREIPQWAIFAVTSIYPLVNILWKVLVLVRAKYELVSHIISNLI